MAETETGTESGHDLYERAIVVDEAPSSILASRRSSNEEGAGSGRHHYRTTTISMQPERKSTMATSSSSSSSTTVSATRNRPASLSPFRPSSKSKHQRDGADRCQRSVGGSRSPNDADGYCCESNPTASGATIWRHPAAPHDKHHLDGNNSVPSTSTSSTSCSSSSSSSSSSGLFSWRKKYPRRSSSSSVVPTSTASSLFSSCVSASPTDSVLVDSNTIGRSSQQQQQHQQRPLVTQQQVQQHLDPRSQQQQTSRAVSASSRRLSQPAAFSLPQLVRRSLQPLISSSPSTEVDDQPDPVSKLRYMKCKQVVIHRVRPFSLYIAPRELGFLQPTVFTSSQSTAFRDFSLSLSLPAQSLRFYTCTLRDRLHIVSLLSSAKAVQTSHANGRAL